MKKILLSVCCAALIFALTACTGTVDTNNGSSSEPMLTSPTADNSLPHGSEGSSTDTVTEVPQESEPIAENSLPDESSSPLSEPSKPVVNTHTHVWNSKVISPTCLVGGYTLNTCSCGATQKTNSTSATGHIWGNWATVKASTSAENGLQRRSCTVCGATEEEALAKLPLSVSEKQAEILKLVNIERTNAGLTPLQYYYNGQTAADVRAAEILTLFSHTRPNGENCFTALEEAGINYWSAGENIAYGYSTPQEVMVGWMNSPGHKANILNENFTHIIVGINGTYWVQLFLTP